jgi:hypothetical protein
MSLDQNFQQFEQLMKNLLSEKNDVRNQAEEIFNQLREERPDATIHALLAVGRQSQVQPVNIYSEQN